MIYNDLNPYTHFLIKKPDVEQKQIKSILVIALCS